jgi:hypothetical protein
MNFKAINANFSGLNSLRTAIKNATFEDSRIRMRVKNIVGPSQFSEPFPVQLVVYIPEPDVPILEIVLVMLMAFLFVAFFVFFMRR